MINLHELLQDLEANPMTTPRRKHRSRVRRSLSPVKLQMPKRSPKPRRRSARR